MEDPRSRLPDLRRLCGDPAGKRESDEAFCPLRALRSGGLHELHSPRGSHGPLALHMAAREERSLVWVQDALSVLELGAISGRGLSVWGLDHRSLIRVRARRPVDALWTMEEAVAAGLDVIGEIEGDPRALDFTATRRLALRAQASRVTCVLVRLGGRASVARSSGARWRWSVRPSRSQPDPFDALAPGLPRWSLEMRRAPSRPPEEWVIETVARDDPAKGRAAHRLRVVSPLAAGKLAEVAAGEGTGAIILPFPGALRA